MNWISIHALREEGDSALWTSARARYDFYPRPPRGGRRDQSVCPNFIHFISIHALREEGDVIVGDVLVCCGGISIHALREEGDP